MAGFLCPCCNVTTEIFPSTTGGAKKMCEELNVPFLGSLLLDPKITRCCDEGGDFISELPESPTIKSLQDIVKSRSSIILYIDCLIKSNTFRIGQLMPEVNLKYKFRSTSKRFYLYFK